MSEPPQQPTVPPRTLSARSTSATGDRDAPGEGRLANVNTTSRVPAPGMTRGGKPKMKFTPKAVPRKTANSTTPKPESLLSGRSSSTSGTSRGRGLGRGRGRGGVAPTPISGPFAAGPAGMEKRSTRQMRGPADSSLTIEKAASEGIPIVPSGTASTTAVKTEGESAQKVTTPRKRSTVTKSRLKKEEDDGYDSPDEFDETQGDDRVDLSDLGFRGGPVSSRRKNERPGRGWKKIELWVEQEEAEEIVIDDDDELSTPQAKAPKQVRVKTEDEALGGITVPVPEAMILDDVEDEEKLTLAEESRARRRRLQLRGKSREEKEEVAREEVDMEVLREQFLSEDGSDVIPVLTLLTQQREQKLLLMQLPLSLPPLRDIKDTVKAEVKIEDPTVTVPTTPVTPPSGRIGQLRVHASGKTVLSYGGVEFTVRLASDVGFAQDFVVINPHEAGRGKAWRLGNVGAGEEGGWLIGVPELKGLHRK